MSLSLGGREISLLTTRSRAWASAASRSFSACRSRLRACAFAFSRAAASAASRAASDCGFWPPARFCWLAGRCCVRSLALARLRCSSVAKPALISWSRRELLIGPVLTDSSWLKIVMPMVSHDGEPGTARADAARFMPWQPAPTDKPRRTPYGYYAHHHPGRAAAGCDRLCPPPTADPYPAQRPNLAATHSADPGRPRFRLARHRLVSRRHPGHALGGLSVR